MVETLPNAVRIADGASIRWDRVPKTGAGSIPAIAPGLAVEILSEANPSAEMERKLCEDFAAGTWMVWYVERATCSARVFSAPDRREQVVEGGGLRGGEVLDVCELPLGQLLAAVEFPAERSSQQ